MAGFDPDFVGNGKLVQGRFGPFMDIKISKASIVHMLDSIGDFEFMNLKIAEKPKPSPKGFTHYMKIDRWKPEDQSQVPEDNGQPAAEDVSQLPPDTDEEGNLPF